MTSLDPTSLDLTAHDATPSLSLIRRARGMPLVQAGLVAGFWLGGEAVVRISEIPIPGGIVGLALLLALLMSGVLKAPSLRGGAQWLLSEMLLFFVPAVLAVLEHRELLGLLGLKILFVILVSTTAVMFATALTVDLCCRRRNRRVDISH